MLQRDSETFEINYSNFMRLDDYFVFYGPSEEGNQNQVLVMDDQQVIAIYESEKAIERVWFAYEDQDNDVSLING